MDLSMYIITNRINDRTETLFINNLLNYHSLNSDYSTQALDNF